MFSNKYINKVLICLSLSIVPQFVTAAPVMNGQISRQVIRNNSHAINRNISTQVLKNLNHKRIHARFHTKAQIKKAQQLLHDLGYKPGMIDGMMGNNTRKAIRNFQKHHSLKTDGELSESLFTKLKQPDH